MGYMGVPLFSSKGEFLGLIAALSKKPFTYEQSRGCDAILKLLVSRVAFDIEREMLQRDVEKRAQLFSSLTNEIRKFSRKRGKTNFVLSDKLNKETWHYKLQLNKYNITPAPLPESESMISSSSSSSSEKNF